MGRSLKRFLSLDFREHLTPTFLKLLLFWNPLWTLLVTLALGNRTPSAILFRWEWNLFEATVVGLLGFGLIRFFLWMEAALARRSGKDLPRHGMGWYLLFLAFLVPPGLYLALRLMVAYINFSYAGNPITPEFHWQYYGTEIFWGWALLLVCFFFMSWQDLRDAAQRSQLRAEELEKERLQALLTKLKDQMNPHFLFNTLNTVASLIPADPSKAERVLVKLSAMFQGVLAATRRTSHPLAQELEFCRDYLEIEKARFGSRLSWVLEVPEGMDANRLSVPVLLLQPLVENAVKHGLSSRAAGGCVWIRVGTAEGRLRLEVEDDGIGFGNSPYAGSGTALENCRKRLDLAFGREGRLEIEPRPGGGTLARLSLPLVPENPQEVQP
jgi:two-component system, LytTR family, sensor kinase